MNNVFGWKRILFIIIPYLIVVSLFQFMGFIVAGVKHIDIASTQTSLRHFIISIFDLIGTVLVLWFFMKYIDKEKFVFLGFQNKNLKRRVFLGVFIGFFIIALGYFILSIIDEIMFINTVFDAKELILSFLVFTIVALAEEMLFRGYILKNFMLSFNKYAALLVSSILFALAHGFNPNMDWLSYLNLFLAGILLGISYIYTKNLWLPIALHFSWNFFQTLFGFNVSGQDFYSLIEFKIIENNILNGGDFGFEGSVLSVIMQIIVIICLWYYYRRNLSFSKNERL